MLRGSRTEREEKAGNGERTNRIGWEGFELSPRMKMRGIEKMQGPHEALSADERKAGYEGQ